MGSGRTILKLIAIVLNVGVDFLFYFGVLHF